MKIRSGFVSNSSSSSFILCFDGQEKSVGKIKEMFEPLYRELENIVEYIPILIYNSLTEINEEGARAKLDEQIDISIRGLNKDNWSFEEDIIDLLEEARIGRKYGIAYKIEVGNEVCDPIVGEWKEEEDVNWKTLRLEEALSAIERSGSPFIVDSESHR